MEIKTTGARGVDLRDLPEKCPFCHHTINPNVIVGHKNEQLLEVFMVCPSSNCSSSFIAYYEHVFGDEWKYTGESSKGTLLGKRFSASVLSISQSFATIYNQAYHAEQNDLIEICGVGYRKALEFLIKDYSIANHPTEKDKIEKKLLGLCIEQYVADSRIKAVAKRAAWLGNDETHYVRKWEGKNLQDLKNLIDLTIHWIEMEELTKSFELEMPE